MLVLQIDAGDVLEAAAHLGRSLCRLGQCHAVTWRETHVRPWWCRGDDGWWRIFTDAWISTMVNPWYVVGSLMMVNSCLIVSYNGGLMNNHHQLTILALYNHIFFITLSELIVNWRSFFHVCGTVSQSLHWHVYFGRWLFWQILPFPNVVKTELWMKSVVTSSMVVFQGLGWLTKNWLNGG